MGIFDIVILVCFLPAIYFGLKNGLIKQLITFCVIFFGIKLSLICSTAVSQWVLEHLGTSEFWGKAISFIVIFLVVAVVFSLLGKVIEKILKITLLGWLNKLLGLILAVCICAMIVSVAIYFFDSANARMHIVPAEKIAESHFYQPMLNLAQSVFPHLKELL